MIAVLLNNAGRLTNLCSGHLFPAHGDLAGGGGGRLEVDVRQGFRADQFRPAPDRRPTDRLAFNLDWAMPAVIVMTVWLLLPFNIILYTAGLQEVPRDYYEAAQVDGASKFQQFRDITIPLITPTTFFVLLITMIGVLFGGFDAINVLTQGGPLDATNVLIYDIYQNAFQYFRMGLCLGRGLRALCRLCLVVTLFNWVLQKRWVHYS